MSKQESRQGKQAQTMAGSVLCGMLVLFAVCGLLAQAASAATLYVDKNHPSANNNNAGTSVNAPLMTIQRAAQLVRAGDTVIVKSGVYDERVTFTSASSGSAGNRVTFKAEPRHSVKMKGFVTTNCHHLRIEGFEIETKDHSTSGGGIYMNSHYLEIVDNYVHDVPAEGIRTGDADHGYVGHNYIYGCQFGITVGGDDWIIEHNEIEGLRHHPERSATTDVDYARFFGFDHIWRYNYFHGTNRADIGSAHLDAFQTWALTPSAKTQRITITGNYAEGVHQGVMMASDPVGNVRDITITNNVFKDCWSWGASVKKGCVNIVILNNLFVDCITHTIGVRDLSTATIKNNTFFRVKRTYWVSNAELESANNLLWQVGDNFTPRATDIVSDPKFVNPNNFLGADNLPFTSDDGWVLEATSPAVDAGATVALSVDQINTPRPQGAAFDIGPRERISTAGSAPTVAIGAPSVATTKSGPVTFQVTYSNATNVTLADSNVSIVASGTAGGTVSVSGSGTTSRTVTLSGITGNGTLRISLAGGTASNSNGTAGSAGPSSSVVVDNTAPSISVSGSNPLTWAHGMAYTDAGATASDSVAGNLTSAINTQVNVNSSVVGTYTVTYSVSDTVGNTANATRTVHVTDQAPPVLTLFGANPMQVTEGNAYNEPGATATDAVDGNLSGAIVINSNVNTSVPGTYSVTYSVSDAAGNSANASRTVQVTAQDAPDTTPPVITIQGANPATISKNQSYVDAGATAADDKDGDLTASIVVDSNVNTATAGNYTVTYRVSDAAGNEAQAQRAVQVVESNTAPTLNPIGSKNVDEAVALTFGISATDPQGTPITLTATSMPSGASFTNHGNGTGTFSWTPNYNQGRQQPYVVTFTASDGELQDSEAVSITVNNVNRKPKVSTAGSKKGRETEQMTFTASAVDDDGDSVALDMDLTALPEDNDATLTDNGDGTATLEWTPKTGDAGDYEVKIVATDDGSPSMTEEMMVDLTIDPALTQEFTFYVDAAASGEVQDGSESFPFTTIAAAMAVVEPLRGDLILVQPGVYSEDVFLKRSATLASVEGPYHTFILGGTSAIADVVDMTTGSSLIGFTVSGKPNASPVETDANAQVFISNCVLATSHSGLHLLENAKADVLNVTFYGNAQYGILAKAGAQVTTLQNCIFDSNGVAIKADSSALLDRGYSAFFNNGSDYEGPAADVSDMAVDPEFVNPAEWNFHLKSTSPLRDAGNPDEAYNDLDGSRNDLGADGGPDGTSDEVAPFAKIFATISKGTAPIRITFDAQESQDEWGIAQYRWDFDAQNGIQVDAQGPVVEHDFTTDRAYTVTLTVVDHNGHEASATHVIELGSGLPVVQATAQPNAGTAPLEVTLVGSATDPNGGEVSYRWDVDGDGNADTTDATTTVVLPEGTQPGRYTFMFTAEEEDGLTADAMVTVTVTSGAVAASTEVSPNQPAVIEVLDENSPLAGASIALPAGALSAPAVVTLSEVNEMPEVPVDTTILSIAALGPAGMVLSAPIDVTLPVTFAKNIGGTIEVALFDETANQWTSTPISNARFTDISEQFIAFKTTRLGTIAVLQGAVALPMLQFSQTAVTVSEADGSVTLTVSLDKALGVGETASVHFVAMSDTAEAGVDFEAVSGTLEFGTNKSIDSIVIPIMNNSDQEANRSFHVVLSNVTGAELGPNAVATVTIMDDDEAFVPNPGSSGSGGCSAGSINPGSTTPPADFLLLALVITIGAFFRKWTPRMATSTMASGPAFG